jgi:hypothetical protein
MVVTVICKTCRLSQHRLMHYYLLFNGSDVIWHHMKTFYMEESTFRYLMQCTIVTMILILVYEIALPLSNKHSILFPDRGLSCL